MFPRTLQIHRMLALFLAGFVVLHLASHLFAWGGIAAHNQALDWVRLIYRNPAVETVLVIAILAQIVMGVRLAWARIRQGVSPGWGYLQLGSGAILMIFLFIHPLAALLARTQMGLDTNFYWPAGTLILAPLKYFFYPYYTLALFAIFSHIGCALHFRGKRGAARIMVLAGVVIPAIILPPFTGALFPIELPPAHAAYYGI